MLVLALFISACDNEPEGVVVEEPVVVEGEGEVVEGEAEVVEGEAEGEGEVEVVEGETEVETEVMTDTQVITDTDVITETLVTTETDEIEVETETTVITETEVSVDTETDVETEVITDTEDIDESEAFAIVLIADSAGGQFLGDPVENRPVFTSESEELIDDERFEPIEFSEELVFGEGLDSALFDEIDQDGVRVLTFNGRPLYRFVGDEGEDWRTPAGELGLSPLTAEGELGEFAD